MQQSLCRTSRSNMWYILILTLLHFNDNNAQLVGINPIYLTVSSLYRDAIQGSVLIDRELQINWSPDMYDSIAIYKDNPSSGFTDPMFQISTLSYPENFVESNVTLGNPIFPGGWTMDAVEDPILGDHCLPFWVVGFKSNEIVHVDCVKIRPTWMQDNRLAIGNLPLSSLFIPGTHNSGCFKRGQSLSQRDIAGRYILTQDQPLWDQLVFGIRYLDFRIGYYPLKKNTSKIHADNCFWINHDLIKVRLLPPVIRELKKFLLRAKDEVVILDLHRFPIGFSNRRMRHEEFITYLERELKPFAIPYTTPTPTLESIWEKDKRLIISYGENAVGKDYDWMWPPIRQLWGNKQSVGKLYEYLESVMSNDSVRDPSKGLWSAMAQLTPGPLDLLFNPKGSLRQMANVVNHNLTKWCRNDWWSKANIIATDFFLETDLINVAVAANVQKGNAPQEYTTFH